MLRSFLISLGVAIGAALVSVPLLVVERWLGFAVLASITFAFLMLRERLGLPGRVQAYRTGFGIAVLILVPASFRVGFLESGFDDGPFTGRRFAGDLSNLVPSDRVAFRAGELIVYNRGNGAAPVLAYRIGAHTKWAHEMFVSTGAPGDKNPARNELSEIAKLRVSSGVIRDRLDFIGRWTYGAEHGYAFVWKWGGVQRFYLSW